MPERRQVPRYLLNVPAKLSPLGSEAVSTVNVVLIGVKGCAFEGPVALGLGQRCKLSIEWRGSQIQAEAEVVVKKKEGRTGLKFLAMPEESMGVLRELCATLQLQPLAPLPPDD